MDSIDDSGRGIGFECPFLGSVDSSQLALPL